MKEKILKSKTFKSKYSDLEVDVGESGWISLTQGEDKISVGLIDGERANLIEKALDYALSEMFRRINKTTGEKTK